MATETRLITVADLADALGLPGQAAAIREGLVADGLTIVEDWAGRPAVAFADAKRTVDRHRKQASEWEERRNREANEGWEAQEAQREFDQIAGLTLPQLRKQDPWHPGPEADQLRAAKARAIALEHVKTKFSAQAVAKLVWKPLVTIEPDPAVAFKVFEVPDTSNMDPELVAKGVFTPKPQRKSPMERVKDLLGGDSED